jgi:uncharacterized membrane protein
MCPRLTFKSQEGGNNSCKELLMALVLWGISFQWSQPCWYPKTRQFQRIQGISACEIDWRSFSQLVEGFVGNARKVQLNVFFPWATCIFSRIFSQFFYSIFLTLREHKDAYEITHHPDMFYTSASVRLFCITLILSAGLWDHLTVSCVCVPPVIFFCKLMRSSYCLFSSVIFVGRLMISHYCLCLFPL